MDARLTDEQRQIQETAEQLARALAPDSPASLEPPADGSASWKKLAEVGFLGMRLPEFVGGAPSSGVEIALVAEQLGRFSVPLPFIGSAVCVSQVLREAGASEDVLRSLGAGELRLAPVLDVRLQRWARAGEDGIAFEAGGAVGGLVVDPVSGHIGVVELGAPLESQDLTRVLRRVPRDSRPLAIGHLGQPLEAEARDRALALALSALAADLSGIMQAALDRAVAYTSDREQFGVKVATFQALQHMAAEALVSVEAARGCALHAAWAVDALPPRAALEAARTAKAYASEHAREVCETAIQMHGGIGMTWEAMPHVHLRRALLGRVVLGDEHFQYSRLAEAWLGEAKETP
ncbi:MAG: acyl-CoA dehydrogenase [Deltaproteobacteria bacterium]|nr:acyl-CoA dehydrogenase [Deltaproteobacteria bacterium]